jgi:acetylornithine deacetylase/succinyl-diaminopimelate desuccinylase-like protein
MSSTPSKNWSASTPWRSKDVPCEQNPAHIAFKDYLKAEAARLGFDFADHGCIVVIGLGQGDEKVGLIAHGDVQPVDPASGRSRRSSWTAAASRAACWRAAPRTTRGRSPPPCTR